MPDLVDSSAMTSLTSVESAAAPAVLILPASVILLVLVRSATQKLGLLDICPASIRRGAVECECTVKPRVTVSWCNCLYRRRRHPRPPVFTRY